MLNIENFHPNNFKIEQKLYKDIVIYCFCYVTPKNLTYLCLIINSAKRYITESNGNKHLKLVHTEESKESKDKLKQYEKIWSKIKDIN